MIESNVWATAPDKREWCAVVYEVPADLRRPLMGSRRHRKDRVQRPHWTVGIKLGRDQNGGYWLLDMVRGRATPAVTPSGQLLVEIVEHEIAQEG